MSTTHEYNLLQIVYRLHGYDLEHPPRMNNKVKSIAHYFPLIVRHKKVFGLLIRGGEGPSEYDNTTFEGMVLLRVINRNEDEVDFISIQELLAGWYVQASEWQVFIVRAKELISKKNKESTAHKIEGFDFRDIGYIEATFNRPQSEDKVQFHLNNLAYIVKQNNKYPIWGTSVDQRKPIHQAREEKLISPKTKSEPISKLPGTRKEAPIVPYTFQQIRDSKTKRLDVPDNPLYGKVKKWIDVVITFVNGDEVSIRVGSQAAQMDFRHMEMFDHRKNDKNKQWLLLEQVAENNGYFPNSRKEDPKKEANARQRQHLANKLKTFFGLQDDPFVKERSKWKTVFTIHPEAEDRPTRI